MRRVAVVLVATLLASITHVATSSGAWAAPSIGPTVDVTNDTFANNEPSLGMDPSGRLLAGAWNDWEYNDGCGFSYSTNGGATWAPESFVPGFTQFTNDPNVPGTGRFAIAGDPAIAFNPKFGAFDVICQTFGSKTGNQIQLQLTTFDPSKADPAADENASYGSAAWTKPVVVPAAGTNGSFKGTNGHFPDHEYMFIDKAQGPGHHYGRIYVVWAQFSGSGRSPIMIAFSDDNGRSWTGPITISDTKNKFDQDAFGSVAPNGDVYVSFITGPNEKSLKKNYVAVARSSDGGATWSPTARIAPLPGAYAKLPNADYRAFSDIRSSVDLATGKLIVVFSDNRTGAAQIWATHQLTADDLDHWSTPVRINPSANEQFFPWTASAPNGRIDVLYYDRTCDPGNVLICVTVSSSEDSGASWSSVSVLGTPFNGDQFETCLEFVQPPDCGRHFIGDYISMESTNDVARVLYTANGPHALDIFSASVSF